MTCDYDVAVRVIESDSVTTAFDFNDRPGGFTVESVQEPEENVRDLRVTAPRVDGSSRVAEAYDDGDLIIVVRVEGATWAECATRWESARAAYRAESDFYVETEIEGVTKRWRTERPNVTPAGLESVSLLRKRQTYSIRFRVQPNPTVTIA